MDVDLGSQQRLALLGLVGVVVLAVAAGAVWLFVLSEGTEPPPDAWDPEAAELVAWVEQERGRSFLHPVRIAFADDDGFAQALGAGAAGPSDGDAARIGQTLDLLRSLALITDSRENDDLIGDVADAVLDGGRFARYIPATRRIVVRADSVGELSTVGRADFVGALSAALHDQYFGVSTASRLDRSSAAVGRRSISAGVADALAERYMERQSERDQAAWRQHRGISSGTGPVDLALRMAMVPDDLGRALVDVAVADTVVDGGDPHWGNVNAMFAAPPRTELELLQPWAAIDGFERGAVPQPEPAADTEVITAGDFGAASLYVVLATRIDPRDALAASLRWSGDSHILTRESSGRVCVAIAVAGIDGDASDLFEDAFDAWSAAGPRQADASVSRDGRVVTLRSCDPGARASTGIVLDPATAVSVVVNRTELLAELRTTGSSRNSAVCTADRLLAEIPVVALDDPDRPPEADTLYEMLLETALRSCRNR